MAGNHDPMKCLAWLLLAVLCTTLTRVQPADLALAEHPTCGCCEQAGDCGMANCALPPVSTSSLANLPVTSETVRVAVRGEATVPRVRFYFSMVKAPANLPAVRAFISTTPSANVSLFEEHCSLLI